MKKLLIIKSLGNDSGSRGYLNKIKKIAKSESDIEIEVVECSDQDSLNNLLASTDCKFLILRPSELFVLPTFHHRNIEDYQVVDATMKYIRAFSIKDKTKILLLGYGNVGKRLASMLHNEKYLALPVRSNHVLDDDFVNQFDIIVNCTNGDESIGYFYPYIVVDVAGNWSAENRTGVAEFNNIPVRATYHPSPDIVSCGKIGTLTTQLMLGSL